MMNPVVELVTFELNSGVTEQQMTAAVEKSQLFVKHLPGFLYRSVCKHEETNTWSDIVYWQSKEEAHSAAEAFCTSEQTKELMTLINAETVKMQHNDVKISFDCNGTCQATA
ncbi:MAG: hypothetical protein JKY55_15500 [Aliivibrio sp.]|uniref:hypothetical protein n=1 Tax=Aliivibrio sp. TaxID=1872443 RepID=UPI001A3F2A95|nr:hypothetical protein [Aliivibrio sp.]